MTIRSRTSSELGLLVVACIGCNAITNLDRYSFTEYAVTQCGLKEEDCATTIKVTGGRFFRNPDPADPTKGTDPVTVSAFRLDKFEVTVGRFRVFVDAVKSGFVIAPSAGKHPVNQGQGLAMIPPTPVSFEKGWSGAALPTTAAEWNASLAPNDGSCGEGGALATWTPTAGPNERRPINCVSWYEAYAFCIWSSGYLPSEAEWLRAAMGTDIRPFPWGTEAPHVGVRPADALHAVFDCFFPGGVGGAKLCDRTSVSNIAPVGSLSDNLNAGPFGHLDLAGNVGEFTLDMAASEAGNGFLTGDCTDCFYFLIDSEKSTARAVRGGGYNDAEEKVTNFRRSSLRPQGRSDVIGFRCAYPE